MVKRSESQGLVAHRVHLRFTKPYRPHHLRLFLSSGPFTPACDFCLRAIFENYLFYKSWDYTNFIMVYS